jgi:DNA-binding FadR family transcriptional regulator
VQREAAPAPALVSAHERTTQTRRPPARPARPATDDEILGLDVASGADATVETNAGTVGAGFKPAPTNSVDGDSSAEPENLRPVFDANPELRAAWQDAQAYRETFATPEEARAATGLLADLDRMDALFFSHKPEDHAELARAVANLDPEAFSSLARAMNGLATEAQRHGGNGAGNQGSVSAANASPSAPAPTPENRRQDAGATTGGEPTPAQAEFFHATNAAAVESVIDAIESQVERLLPEGVSKTARNRVVGEIYRELDTTLRSNRQLAQQMREAFRSGALDADHQHAIVSLIAGRARQALPGVAKRVLNEWTSTVVAANQDRRARQRAAERRVDIAGSSGAGNDGHRSMTPRDIDYPRMSDSDILNL